VAALGEERPGTVNRFSITWKSHWVYQEADARGMNHLLRQMGVSPPRRRNSRGKIWARPMPIARSKAKAQLGR
jgi:hypothetical protein